MAEKEFSDEESVASEWSEDEEFAWELRGDTRFDNPDIVARTIKVNSPLKLGNTNVYLLP